MRRAGRFGEAPPHVCQRQSFLKSAKTRRHVHVNGHNQCTHPIDGGVRSKTACDDQGVWINHDSDENVFVCPRAVFLRIADGFDSMQRAHFHL